MDASSGNTRVWRSGRFQEGGRGEDAAMTALCQAVERAVRAHQTSTTSVRAVILMIDQPVPSAELKEAEPELAPVPVYVDVFDSGFGHDSGYGHGI